MKFKSPVMIGALSGGVATLAFNRTKFGPWYWHCFDNWNKDNKRVMDSLKGEEEINNAVPSYLSQFSPK